MKTFTIWNNDLGDRSITYHCSNDPYAGGPYDWTLHYNPNQYDEYCKTIRNLERQGYKLIVPKPFVPGQDATLVPALFKKKETA